MRPRPGWCSVCLNKNLPWTLFAPDYSKLVIIVFKCIYERGFMAMPKQAIIASASAGLVNTLPHLPYCN
eukprot:g29598.t1